MATEAFRTSPTDSILYSPGELLNLLGEKELFYYEIKKKSTPYHIGYNNYINNKTTDRMISIKNLISSTHNIFFQLINKINIYTSVKNNITYPNIHTLSKYILFILF